MGVISLPTGKLVSGLARAMKMKTNLNTFLIICRYLIIHKLLQYLNVEQGIAENVKM
jgi:hypothetical protein